jgi:hypothetical protein
MDELMTEWQHWKDNLAGKSVPLHESTPHAGFYRSDKRGFRLKLYEDDPGIYVPPFTPIAYWPNDDGKLNCRIGDNDVSTEQGHHLWVSICNHPVAEESYRGKAERNEPWPDEHELVDMGHNLPPKENSFEELRDSIEPLAQEAKRRLDGPPVSDQDEADRIANLADRLAELHKLADDVRKEEKRPHDEAAKQVQLKWTPILLLAETYKNLKYKLLTPWLKAQEQAQKAEAEAAAAAGDPLAPQDTRRPRVGTRGRAMVLKSLKRAEITNYDECLAFFKESPDVKATVQDLANRAVRAGISVPGAKLVEESQTV